MVTVAVKPFDPVSSGLRVEQIRKLLLPFLKQAPAYIRIYGGGTYLTERQKAQLLNKIRCHLGPAHQVQYTSRGKGYLTLHLTVVDPESTTNLSAVTH